MEGKIHQNLLLQFCKTLSWKLLEVEGLFQGNNTLCFSWFYPLPSASALNQYRWQDWHEVCSHPLLSPFYRDKFNPHQGLWWSLLQSPRQVCWQKHSYMQTLENKQTNKKEKQNGYIRKQINAVKRCHALAVKADLAWVSYYWQSSLIKKQYPFVPWDVWGTY